MSDTIVVMDQGKIQQIGTPEDIYNEPQNWISHLNPLKSTMVS